MPHRFVHFVKQFGHLGQTDIQLIQNALHTSQLSKGHYYYKVGQVFPTSAFITEGVLRSYSCNELGDETTHYFVRENQIISNLCNHFNTAQFPMCEYIQAITDCTLIHLPPSILEVFDHEIPTWKPIFQRIGEHLLMQKISAFGQMISEDATTRYVHFVEKYPDLVQRVPLTYISSYLGITQSSLSRIRKQVMENDFLPNGKKTAY